MGERLVVGRGGKSHNRRCPRGSGPEDYDAGTRDYQSGERHRPHPETRGDSDGRSLARSAGIVSGTRGDQGGTGQ